MGSELDLKKINKKKRFPDILRVRSIAEVPRFNLFNKFERFPNKYFPSDHFSLCVEFEYNF